MDWRNECAVVIPCLNEAEQIAAVVRGAREFLPAVFVVDDGSSDGTGEIAQACGAEVLSHDQPQGKGAALCGGFRKAAREGFAWALAMDGDGQHSPWDIPRFFEGPDAKMVIGNRFANGVGGREDGYAAARNLKDAATSAVGRRVAAGLNAGLRGIGGPKEFEPPHVGYHKELDRATGPHRMPVVRRVVNGWMSRTLSEFTGVNIPDSQCGFRLIDLDAWMSISISARHFEIESELLVRFAAAGFSIRSVPIQTRYASERSKINPLRDTLRWFRWWREIHREFQGEPVGWRQPQFSHDLPV